MKTFKEFFLEHCGCPYADAEAAEEEKKQELKKKRRRKIKEGFKEAEAEDVVVAALKEIGWNENHLDGGGEAPFAFEFYDSSSRTSKSTNFDILWGRDKGETISGMYDGDDETLKTKMQDRIEKAAEKKKAFAEKSILAFFNALRDNRKKLGISGIYGDEMIDLEKPIKLSDLDLTGSSTYVLVAAKS